MRRGDVYHVTLDPSLGHEQAGKRYVLIVSPDAFNRISSPLCCPITMGGNFARNAGFTVNLTATGMIAQGVVLCHQIRALDLKARNASFVERAPQAVVTSVLHALQDLVAL